MLVRFKNKPACEGTDTELWFTDSSVYDNEPLLYKICSGCPAKQECLDYALEYKVLGYWAGTNAARREQIRKAKGIIGKPVLPEWEIRTHNA